MRFMAGAMQRVAATVEHPFCTLRNVTDVSGIVSGIGPGSRNKTKKTARQKGSHKP